MNLRVELDAAADMEFEDESDEEEDDASGGWHVGFGYLEGFG